MSVWVLRPREMAKPRRSLERTLKLVPRAAKWVAEAVPPSAKAARANQRVSVSGLVRDHVRLRPRSAEEDSPGSPSVRHASAWRR